MPLRPRSTRRIIARPLSVAAVLLVTLLPGVAYAAQETKFGSAKQVQLRCGADQHGCGKVVAVVNVTAVKDSPGRPWHRQRTIQLSPFTTGGRFNTTTENPPGVQICTELRILVAAGGQIASSAPFGDIGLALDTYEITTTGNTSFLAGYKCRSINAYQASINVRPDNAFIDSGRSAIDKVTIKARTTLYFWAQHYYKTPWARDTINFD
ncbi:MAG: hypothetical protein M3237_09375 [Actinomycetota bacterium]|nr:hypothetical protein [Actinomycetota bacterium]